MLNANEIIALFCIKVGWASPLPEAASGHALQTLQDQDLINEYGVTERGAALVSHIEKLPLPVSSWRMP
jgi:hypothetical protein